MTVDSFENRSYNLSTKTSAIAYWSKFIDSTSEKGKLKLYESNDFIFFGSEKIDGNDELNEMEQAWNAWINEYGFQKPDRLVTLFSIPQSDLDKWDKKQKGFHIHIEWPSFISEQQQAQTAPHGFSIHFHYYKVPLLNYKRDFIKFIYLKDHIVIGEGQCGYSNPFDFTVVTFERNYTGALNHELFHLLLYDNFPVCPAWLNEGLASLYEASLYDETTGTMIPNPNFRATEVRDTINLVSNITWLLKSDWTRLQANSEVNVALARNICYFLHEHKLLQPLVKEMLKRYRNGEYPDEADATQLLLDLGHYNNLIAFTQDFLQFVKTQQRIVAPHGKLKNRYKSGLYENGQFF